MATRPAPAHVPVKVDEELKQEEAVHSSLMVSIDCSRCYFQRCRCCYWHCRTLACFEHEHALTP